jgi:hypothetical protein
MELSKKHLKQVFGGNIIGAGSDGSPDLPKKKEAQSSEPVVLVNDPTAPIEPPKP